MENKIIEKALEFGADLAGIAAVEQIKSTPSHINHGRFTEFAVIGTLETNGYATSSAINLPAGAKSAIVIGLVHPASKTELDWWDGWAGTPGNRILIRINKELRRWLEKETGFAAYPLPYHVERGGLFLKDAAVAAGLGCVGKNNLLVTPEFGPRVRLRCILTDMPLEPTGPVRYDPCESCDEPCRRSCPRKAFSEKKYDVSEFGEKRPGRNGCYDRHACNKQMEKDTGDAEDVPATESTEAYRRVKYCRNCEMSCPVGKPAE